MTLSNESNEIVTPAEAQRSVAEVLELADKGQGKCRVCKKIGPLGKFLTCWKDGHIVFAICEDCMGSSVIVMERVSAGYKIKASRKSAITL